ncbi:hypothetical protein DSO57_1015593 [Entomophthora muscae]|uniref:Uncharacterized protein n=1 Tax=Entomophthora muscae TaxID=34485 RepID=A0ACC2SHV1_9FUNG|nr:hypothetical protein DSO57_1015593 [Entomophthora muscae]
MLQHIVTVKTLSVESKELRLVPINCDHPVDPAAVQEMIEQYFQEHPVSLAAVCTTEEKKDPAKTAAFDANKSASGYFLFYGNIVNCQTICCQDILLNTGASENFMSVETVDLLQLKYHLGMFVRSGNCQMFPSFQLKKPVSFIVAGQSFMARFSICSTCGKTLHQLVAGILIIVESFLTEWDPDCLLNRAINPDVHSTN